MSLLQTSLFALPMSTVERPGRPSPALKAMRLPKRTSGVVRSLGSGSFRQFPWGSGGFRCQGAVPPVRLMRAASTCRACEVLPQTPSHGQEMRTAPGVYATGQDRRFTHERSCLLGGGVCPNTEAEKTKKTLVRNFQERIQHAKQLPKPHAFSRATHSW